MFCHFGCTCKYFTFNFDLFLFCIVFTFIVLGVDSLPLRVLFVQLRVHYGGKQYSLNVFLRAVVSNLFCCMLIAVPHGFWLSGSD